MENRERAGGWGVRNGAWAGVTGGGGWGGD